MPPPSAPLIRRRSLLAGLGLASGLATLGCASHNAPARSTTATDLEGDGWTALEADWHDATRARDVPVRLYLPQRAAAVSYPPTAVLQAGTGALPLVVFSHGIGGSRRGYRYLGQHWAQQGFASLHVQHVGSDQRLWRAGSLWSLPERLQTAAQTAEALDRAYDVRFALDTLLTSAWAAVVDASRMAVAGHSYGANTALLLTGARVERPGQPSDLRDPRLRGAVLISAPPLYGEADPQRILSPVQVPTLHITATDDVIRVPGYYSPAADRVAVYEQVGSPHKTLAVFSGGSHSMFTDRLRTGGAALNPRVKQATQALTTAFLDGLLRQGKPPALQDWAHQHAPLLARFEQQGMPLHVGTRRLDS
ncbi:hypothetical protein [Acidovorax lacteus]|uniref:Acetylhydrolase n=1 Tax=Acidovorax lacteus TaxID=1924988 RepID=A0ABP8KXE3_9BURK